jgi:predicted enzyme related to lactoylglutathione lyase
VIQVEGLAAGALIDLAQFPPKVPAVIGVMIKVENAEATVARVCALGGQAEPVMDVMGNGRMATCTDTEGGMFNIWQPLTKDGAECDPCIHGAPTWFELLTTDLDQSATFYTNLFGWEKRVEQPAPGMTYITFYLEGSPIAGAMKLMPDLLGKVPPHWGTYFTVNNADVTVELVRKLKGEICVEPQGIPNVGRFALLKSPQGVSFHVLQHAAH